LPTKCHGVGFLLALAAGILITPARLGQQHLSVGKIPAFHLSIGKTE